nr:unnamed protein product [Callosobruchus analis]
MDGGEKTTRLTADAAQPAATRSSPPPPDAPAKSDSKKKGLSAMLMPGSRAKPKSPPSSSRTKPVAQSNQNHTGGTLNSGGTGATGAIICPNCDRRYMTKSSLAKHLLSCGVRVRSKCCRHGPHNMH